MTHRFAQFIRPISFNVVVKGDLMSLGIINAHHRTVIFYSVHLSSSCMLPVCVSIFAVCIDMAADTHKYLDKVTAQMETKTIL